MGKVSYRPKKNQNRNETKRQREVKQEPVSLTEEEIEALSGSLEENTEIQEEYAPKISARSNKKNQHKLDNIKVVGDLECDYHIYIEDYVYTYLYQLASADLAKESSAVLVGEIFRDSKEAVVRGIIPIDVDKLQEGAEWIDMGVVEEAEQQRKSYFANQDIIGWMHMQPGYGTMLTMKELREHQSVFEGDGTICMLVDAINKIETLFVYEEDELKEQSGYCMYYERNEEMQQFMLDHPFSTGTKEEMKDTVVNQFREIGKIRKAEYAQRKSLNLTVMAASVILIALTAIIVKMNDHKVTLETAQLAAQAADLNDMQEGENGILSSQQGLDKVSDENAIVDDMNGEESSKLGEALVGEEQEMTVVDDKNVEEGNADKASNVMGEENGKQEDAQVPSQKLNEEKGDYSIYIVESGDTLADICYKQYGSAERSLEVAKFNGMTNTNELFVGQELKMPK